MFNGIFRVLVLLHQHCTGFINIFGKVFILISNSWIYLVRILILNYYKQLVFLSEVECLQSNWEFKFMKLHPSQLFFDCNFHLLILFSNSQFKLVCNFCIIVQLFWFFKCILFSAPCLSAGEASEHPAHQFIALDLCPRVTINSVPHHALHLFIRIINWIFYCGVIFQLYSFVSFQSCLLLGFWLLVRIFDIIDNIN